MSLPLCDVIPNEVSVSPFFMFFILTFVLPPYIIINILIGNDCIIVVNLSSYRKKEPPAESFFTINKLMNFNTGASHFVRV